MRRFIIIFAALILVIAASFFVPKTPLKQNKTPVPTIITPKLQELSPLSILQMRKESYPGSEIKIEQTLPPGENYDQYLTSYISEGLKIYALLTVPIGVKPKNGWP